MSSMTRKHNIENIEKVQKSYKVNYILKENTIPWKITTSQASHI